MSGNTAFAEKGNFWNVVSLLLTASYTLSVLLFRGRGIFDPEWEAQGFCVSDQIFGMERTTSHDLSLYVDLILAGTIGLFYWNWKDLPQMQGQYSKRCHEHIFGIIGHGIAHGFIANLLREKDTNELGETEMTALQVAFSGVFFWFPLLYPYLSRFSFSSKVGIAGSATFGTVLIPKTFGFCYVQSVIMLCFGVNELTQSRAEKDNFEYALLARVAGIPIILMGWVEAMFCNSFYKAIGGHVWFDASIGISALTFYIVVYYYGPNELVHDKKHLS